MVDGHEADPEELYDEGSTPEVDFGVVPGDSQGFWAGVKPQNRQIFDVYEEHLSGYKIAHGKEQHGEDIVGQVPPP